MKQGLLEQHERDFFEDVVCGRLEDTDFETEYGSWTPQLYQRYLQTDWWHQQRTKAQNTPANAARFAVPDIGSKSTIATTRPSATRTPSTIWWCCALPITARRTDDRASDGR
jgi:hypothetical protein